jgi:hypothetical protein
MIVLCFSMQEGNVTTSMTTSTIQQGKEEENKRILFEHVNDTCCLIILMINFVHHQCNVG